MFIGKGDSIHHHLLEVIFETATAPELKTNASVHHPLWVVVVVVVVYRIGFPTYTLMPSRPQFQSTNIYLYFHIVCHVTLYCITSLHNSNHDYTTNINDVYTITTTTNNNKNTTTTTTTANNNKLYIYMYHYNNNTTNNDNHNRTSNDNNNSQPSSSLVVHLIPSQICGTCEEFRQSQW